MKKEGEFKGRLKELGIAEKEFDYLRTALNLNDRSIDDALDDVRMIAEEFDKPNRKVKYAAFIEVDPTACALIAVIQGTIKSNSAKV